MERVHEAFAGNYFDLTHVRNAMDHSANPLQAMRSLLSVTKPGGKLVLHHARKEGSQQDSTNIWSTLIEKMPEALLQDLKETAKILR